jgi:nucleotide-binding universal stress UspA family protein
MSFKEILVHIDSTRSSLNRLDLGLALARRFKARLSGLHVTPDPEVPPYFKPSVVQRISAIYAKNAREAADLAETLFRERTRGVELQTNWETIEGDLAETIAERARFSDLLLLGQFDTENPRSISAFLLPARVVYGAAAPILVVPNTGTFTDLGKHAVIAWDGSREAARTVRDAMPLLHAAERVSLIAVDPFRQGHIKRGASAPAFVSYLQQHAVHAEAAEISAQGKSVAEILLEYTAEVGADLLVIGAYGHSRVLEFILGGTTADLLERATTPILISH